MRDWYRELPPGTLLCRKKDRVFAIVISIQVQTYPGPWTQLYLLIITALGELLDLDIESSTFYDNWLKVLT